MLGSACPFESVGTQRGFFELSAATLERSENVLMNLTQEMLRQLQKHNFKPTTAYSFSTVPLQIVTAYSFSTIPLLNFRFHKPETIGNFYDYTLNAYNMQLFFILCIFYSPPVVFIHVYA